MPERNDNHEKIDERTRKYVKRPRAKKIKLKKRHNQSHYRKIRDILSLDNGN